MRTEPSFTTTRSATPLTVCDGTLVLSGYALRISVFHGRLAVSDNLNGERRVAEFSRATCGIRRCVLLGHSGFVTLEALRWLADIGATYIQIDADGKLIACYAPEGTDDVHRRRALALAAGTTAGIAIARALVRAKLTGQAELLDSRGLDAPSSAGAGRFSSAKRAMPSASIASVFVRWSSSSA